ncbi:MAG: tetratricopeptide repeat protein, partial [Myxococcaceae bacterium]
VQGAVVVGALVCAVAAGTLWLRSRAQLCTGASEKLAKSWGDERRNAARLAFEAAAKPANRGVWGSVELELDRYAKGWAEQHTEACRATRVRGEQSEAALDLRMNCLSQRLSDLSALTAQYAQADGKVVERAIEAAQALPRLSTCADVGRLSSRVPMPDEGLRARVDELQGKLSEVKALRDLGKYAVALERVKPLVEQARALGYRPALADAQFRLGELLDYTGDVKGSEGALYDAAFTGEASRYDEVAVKAYIRLIYELGLRQPRYDQARLVGRHGLAVLERMGGSEELEGKLVGSLAAILDQQGLYQEAMVQHQRAAVLLEKSLGPGNLELAMTLTNLSVTLDNLGEYEKSLPNSLRALEIRQALLGAKNPNVALSVCQLGLELGQLGRFEEARARHETALAAYQETLGPEHFNVSFPVGGLGIVAYGEGKYDEALGHLARARTLAEKTLGHDHPFVADALGTEALALLALGRDAEARKAVEEALRLGTAARGADHPLHVVMLTALSQLERAAGAPEKARELAQKALAAAEKGFGAKHPGTAEALTCLGQALLAEGKSELAVAPLERSALIEEARSTVPNELARTRFALARALRMSDPARSAEQLEKARPAFVSRRLPVHEVEEFDAFLKTLPPRRR